MLSVFFFQPPSSSHVCRKIDSCKDCWPWDGSSKVAKLDEKVAHDGSGSGAPSQGIALKTLKYGYISAGDVLFLAK